MSGQRDRRETVFPLAKPAVATMATTVSQSAGGRSGSCSMAAGNATPIAVAGLCQLLKGCLLASKAPAPITHLHLLQQPLERATVCSTVADAAAASTTPGHVHHVLACTTSLLLVGLLVLMAVGTAQQCWQPLQAWHGLNQLRVGAA